MREWVKAFVLVGFLGALTIPTAIQFARHDAARYEQRQLDRQVPTDPSPNDGQSDMPDQGGVGGPPEKKAVHRLDWWHGIDLLWWIRR